MAAVYAPPTAMGAWYPWPMSTEAEAVTEDALDELPEAVATLSALDDECAPVEEESLQHREAAAVMDGLARGLLWKISDCTFIPGTEVVEFIDDYDGLRAVLRVVRAGWATAGPRGLYVTERGRDVAAQLFVDR